MDIKIKGHSGCFIKVIDEDGKLYVVKYTEDVSYFKRIQDQCNKQENFIKINQISNISSPNIIRRIEDKNKSGMVMDFIYAKNYIDYFENACNIAPKCFVDTIIKFIENEFNLSKSQLISSDIMIKKLNSVKHNISLSSILCNDKEIFDLINKSEKLFHDYMMIPVGICHGDLTFSNILFQENKIYIIDFLDSFIETPLMDLVKLRQDSRYGWSEMLYQDKFDYVKNRIIMEYIDKLLWKHFEYFPGVKDNYIKLQVMNFLRILQYAKDMKIINYLKRNLFELLSGENNNE